MASSNRHDTLKLIALMESQGAVVTRGGKHWKVYFPVGVFAFAMPVTSSDVNSRWRVYQMMREHGLQPPRGKRVDKQEARP